MGSSIYELHASCWFQSQILLTVTVIDLKCYFFVYSSIYLFILMFGWFSKWKPLQLSEKKKIYTNTESSTITISFDSGFCIDLVLGSWYSILRLTLHIFQTNKYDSVTLSRNKKTLLVGVLWKYRVRCFLGLTLSFLTLT